MDVNVEGLISRQLKAGDGGGEEEHTPVDGSVRHQTVLQLLHLSPLNLPFVSSKPCSTKQMHRPLPFRLGTSGKRRCLFYYYWCPPPPPSRSQHVIMKLP